MVTEAILGGIVEAIFAYALEQSGLADGLRSALGIDPVKRAFGKALEEAYRVVSHEYPSLAANLFDASFLQHEAVPVLARLLWRHGRPTGPELAVAWADSLGLEGDVRQNGLAELSPVADRFLQLLEEEAKKRPQLQQVFDHRTREQIAAHTAVLPEIRDLLRDHLSPASSPGPPSTRSGDGESGFPVNPDLTDRLLHTFLQIPALSDRDNRTMLLRGLPPGPVGAIGRSSAPLTDLNNILSAVASWGRLASGELALAVVARNALVFVKGTELQPRLAALLAEIEIGDNDPSR